MRWRFSSALLLVCVTSPDVLFGQCLLPENLTADVGITINTTSSSVRAPASAVLSGFGKTCWEYTVTGTIKISQDSPRADFTTTESHNGEFNVIFEAPAQEGSCYSTTLAASGGGLTKNTAAGPQCWSTVSGPPGGNDEENHENGEPLILDLNGDGIWTTSIAEAPVWFDLNGNGIVDFTAWTAPGHDDGLLYADWNRNRTIDGGQELFGDATFLPDGTRARFGYEAISAYDDPLFGGSGDGAISHADRIWSRLRLWVDRNHDGLASNDEQYTLDEMGIIEISLAYRFMGQSENFGTDVHGNIHMRQGVFLQRVRRRVLQRAIHEVYFRALLR